MVVSPSRLSRLARVPVICAAMVVFPGCEQVRAPALDLAAVDEVDRRSSIDTGSTKFRGTAYHQACERLCVKGPQRCADPKALPSKLQAKLDDPQSQRACTALCVNERKLELAESLRFGLAAARCQHRANLATLCVLNHDCQASPVLLDNGELSFCNEAFQFALSACQGQSRAGLLM